MNSVAEFRDSLYTAHKRDLRLSIISVAVYLTIALVILGLLYKIAWKAVLAYVHSTAKEVSSDGFLQWIVPIILFTLAGYLVYYIWSVARRPKKIEECVNSVEAGAVASNINEYIVYKLVFPLGKIKLQFSPMTYARFTIVGDKQRIYEFPIERNRLMEIKTLLSGVAISDIEATQQELYSSEATLTEESTPLPTAEEFRVFAEGELAGALTDVEEQRVKTKRRMRIMLVPTILIVLVVIGYVIFTRTSMPKLNPLWVVASFVLLSLVYSVIVKSIQKVTKVGGPGVEHSYKTQVLERLIQFVSPNAKYVRHSHLQFGDMMSTGFFTQKAYDISGNDLIVGRQSGVPYQMSDVTMKYLPKLTHENAQPETVFRGQAFVAKFPRELKGEVYVVGRFSSNLLSGTQMNRSYRPSLGAEVKLEDPEFNKVFKVYASDQLEARYILTPSMMERLKKLASLQKDNAIVFSFKESRVAILRPSGKDSFELKVETKSTVQEQVARYYEELVGALQVIDELKLNINIWQS